MMATSADPLLESAGAAARGVDALCMFAADGSCDFKCVLRRASRH
jgi:hypothetical protein